MEETLAAEGETLAEEEETYAAEEILSAEELVLYQKNKPREGVDKKCFGIGTFLINSQQFPRF